MILKRTVQTLSVFCAAVLLVGCGSDSSSFSILPDANTFQQSTDSVNTKIDILWVIDNSGSMRTSQEDLANNFQSFISNFQSKGYDFQMAVTTTDAYLANSRYQSFYDYDGIYGDYSQKYFYELPQGDKALFRDGVPGGSQTGQPILSHQSNPLESLFQINILQGIDGWGYERAFESMVETLDHPMNQGLLRPDSFFAVIIVTDEDDFSTADYSWSSTSYNPIQTYVDYLDNLTGTSGVSRRYNVNNISILDDACRDSLNDTFTERIVADRVHALTAATDGFQGSLCGDFGQELSLIADQIITLSNQFYLDRVPIESSIVVIVDGQVIPKVDPSGSEQGWYYNSEANSVIFTAGAVPAQGAAISINFDPEGLDL